MRKLRMGILCAALAMGAVLFAVSSYAGKSEETKIKSEAKKLATDVEVDFDKALAAAKKEGKILMLEFTGSQWCPPCKMFHKFVLNSEKFAKYAKDKMKVVLADFSRDGNPTTVEQQKNHEKLANDFSIRAFPTIILINPKNDAMTKMEGLPSTQPEQVIEIIENFREKTEKMPATK